MTDTTTVESSDTDNQRTDYEQSKSQRVKTTIEFFVEKFADNEEETEPVWIDPKGDPEELSTHRFVAGQTGAGKSVVHLAGLLDEDADGEREAKS